MIAALVSIQMESLLVALRPAEAGRGDLLWLHFPTAAEVDEWRTLLAATLHTIGGT